MIGGLRAIGWTVRLVRLDDTFPFPTAAARAEAAAALAAIADGELTIIDGLALGALPDEAAAHATRLPMIALVHHPLALETGLTAEQAATLEASERRALAAARQVVVTSRATAATLSQYDVEPARITTIEPGTDPAPLARIHREPATEAPHRPGKSPLCSHGDAAQRIRSSSSTRSRRCRSTTGRCAAPAAPIATRRRRLASVRGSRTRALRPAWSWSAISGRRRSAPNTIAPTSSSWRRSTKAMEWLSPRRWRGGCPW